MKTLRHALIISSLLLTGLTAASASYYYPGQQYQYQYQYDTNYTYPGNYVVSNYTPAANTLSNCYYTQSYPPTYYGNCYGMNTTYNYQNTQYNYNYNYQYQNTYVPAQTYPVQSYYPVNTTYGAGSQYQTYGYSNGSWYPGYSNGGLGGVLNNVINSYGNTNCYYQNGYQVCY
jgi:hypothetical protein